jgi:hypothetical protein
MLGVVATGCLGPRVSDEVPMRDVFPAGTEVPWVSGEKAEQIAEYDGVDEIIPRISAFANGDRTWYWDFGPAIEYTAPLWLLVDDEGPIDHPPVWDVVPGDPAYSPFWAINFVHVTEKYAGEVITSRQGIDDAIREGLLEEAVSADAYKNCPVVPEGTLLEVGGGVPAIDPEYDGHGVAYYRGMEVAYFDFDERGARPLEGREMILGSVYELTRVSESLPLSEPVRQVDMNGDGDTNDTNNVFDLYLGKAGANDDYSPLWQVVHVTVPEDTVSIDSNCDPVTLLCTFLTERHLFERGADGSRTPAIDPDTDAPYIVGYEETERYVNCPLQLEAGRI